MAAAGGWLLFQMVEPPSLQSATRAQLDQQVQDQLQRRRRDALPPDENNPVYRFPAEISLNTQTLKLKDGTQLPLQAGMSLRASIKLRKVTYLQLLLGGFQDKAAALKRT